MKPLQYFLIIGILLVSGGGYTIFGVIPDMKVNGLSSAATTNRMYYCDGAALKDIQAYGKELELEWEDQVLDAQLGYSMVTLDFSSAETFVSNQCTAAEDFVKQVKSGDPSLYDKINMFKKAKIREAKNMQKSVYNTAIASLEVLKIIKSFEESQPQNTYALYAKNSACLGKWDFVQFYGNQAIAAYQSQSGP